MDRERRFLERILVIGAFAAAAPLFAGFGSTEVFLPAVGRAPGAGGAQIYTTVWATNLTGAPETFTFHFLKQGQSNAAASSPIARSQAGAALASTSFTDTLAPGETKVYENVVETKLGLSGVIGAARIVSSGEIFVSERIFNQSPGDDLGKTEGMFFTGVPKGFSISPGQSASVQAVDQGGSESFRTNFVLVETGGGSPTVNVQVFDGMGAMLGQKAYPLLPYEQILPNVGDVVPGIATTNARPTATVTGGTGSAILALAQIANESQDPSGAEMTFRDSLLGSGGGTAGVTSLNGLTGALTLTPGNGISIMPSGSSIDISFTGGGSSGLTSVTHDASLSGAGTGASPLSIASGEVVRSLNGLHDNLTLAAGSNVTITPNGSTLTIASSGGGGGGLTLPFSGTTSSAGTAFSISNSGTGQAIEGDSGSNSAAAIKGVNSAQDGQGVGVLGESGYFAGVLGSGFFHGVVGNTKSASGYVPTNQVGVWGDSQAGVGIVGTSSAQLGIYGHSDASIAIQGVSATDIGVWGESKSGAGTNAYGIYGISASGSGVYGTVNGGFAGVSGVNNGSHYGVYGESSGSYGVFGTGSGPAGVYGSTTGGDGVLGQVTSTVHAGVSGTNASSGPGVYAQSDSGSGIYATSSTGSAGYFGGNLTYTGSLIHSSDARFKKNIVPIRDALKSVLRLRGVTFDWRSDEFPDHHFSAARSDGFIAQEVEPVFPSLVSTDDEGYKGVDYAALTPILVEAIKAQQNTIDAQQRKIDEVTERVARLEAGR